MMKVGCQSFFFHRRLEQAELQLAPGPVRRRLLAERLEPGVDRVGVVGPACEAGVHHQTSRTDRRAKGLSRWTLLPA